VIGHVRDHRVDRAVANAGQRHVRHELSRVAFDRQVAQAAHDLLAQRDHRSRVQHAGPQRARVAARRKHADPLQRQLEGRRHQPGQRVDQVALRASVDLVEEQQRQVKLVAALPARAGDPT
jgi:hypothetical protein